MTAITIEELALGERKFLHDIANHIVVAHGMSSFVHKALKEKMTVEVKDIERLEKAIEAINKMTAHLVERRNFLKTITE